MSSMKVLLFVLLLSVVTAADNRNVKNMFTIQVKEKYTDNLIEDLKVIKLFVLYKVRLPILIKQHFIGHFNAVI
jgi:hypothetical protein